MHTIEPFHRWEPLYQASEDPQSPFYGKSYNFEQYSQTIYNYYIDPAWDSIGSESLYLKVLYVDYERSFCIIELLGEWNDALHNDVMQLMRELIEPLLAENIQHFLLIGENVLNFHGSDDSYYEEWYEQLEEGWIAPINFREFIWEEWRKYRLDYYLHYGGDLEIENWRTLHPLALFQKVDYIIHHRLGG